MHILLGSLNSVTEEALDCIEFLPRSFKNLI